MKWINGQPANLAPSIFILFIWLIQRHQSNWKRIEELTPPYQPAHSPRQAGLFSSFILLSLMCCSLPSSSTNKAKKGLLCCVLIEEDKLIYECLWVMSGQPLLCRRRQTHSTIHQLFHSFSSLPLACLY